MLQLPQSSVTPPRVRSATGRNAAAKPDPVFAAIERHREAVHLACSLSDELDAAEDAAREKLGPNPLPLVAWRNYSHIGGDGIDWARDDFLAQATNDAERKAIDREYRDAKRRYAARLREAREWIVRAGLGDLEDRGKRASAERERLATALSETSPTTTKEAAALLRYVLDDPLTEELEWHIATVETVAAALAGMK